LIDPSLALPVAVRDITLCICELGWLFARVSTYLKRIFAGNADAHGLVVQAFGFAIQEELQDYYRLLAVLEQEVQRPPASTAQQQQMSAQFLAPTQENDLKFASKPARHGDASDATATAALVVVGGTPVTASNLTLLRLKAWMQEPLERMCLMARLVDGAGSLLGGALASRLHAHARHGDLQTSSFVQRLMDSVCSPLYTMCIRWILHGELQDPHHEFFIVAAAGTSATNPAKNPWRDAYFLRPQLLPCFLPRPLAEKMLNIGRSINFLKMCFQRLPKEKQQYQAYQKMMMKMTGHGARAKRSFRMMNKQKKLTTYGRVVDEMDDDAVTLEGGGGGGGGGGEAAERESVVSASTMAQQTAAAKGTLQCRVGGGCHLGD
jgi:gamma-tubulin complex component 3